MSNIIRNLVHAAHRFTGADFAVFKICLLAIGILLGAYFSSFFLKYISAIWIVAILTWLILMIQIVRYYKKRKQE
jgi:small multidrug resistance family-3 protein